MSSEAILWVVVVALLVVAGFFAMAETAITRMSKVKAIALQEEGRRGSTALMKIVDHPEQFLNPVLLLVLICHLTMGTLVGLLAEGAFGPAGIALGILF